jgi:hypothetical protein
LKNFFFWYLICRWLSAFRIDISNLLMHPNKLIEKVPSNILRYFFFKVWTVFQDNNIFYSNEHTQFLQTFAYFLNQKLWFLLNLHFNKYIIKILSFRKTFLKNFSIFDKYWNFLIGTITWRSLAFIKNYTSKIQICGTLNTLYWCERILHASFHFRKSVSSDV